MMERMRNVLKPLLSGALSTLAVVAGFILGSLFWIVCWFTELAQYILSSLISWLN